MYAGVVLWPPDLSLYPPGNTSCTDHGVCRFRLMIESTLVNLKTFLGSGKPQLSQHAWNNLWFASVGEVKVVGFKANWIPIWFHLFEATPLTTVGVQPTWVVVMKMLVVWSVENEEPNHRSRGSQRKPQTSPNAGTSFCFINFWRQLFQLSLRGHWKEARKSVKKI